MKFRLFVVLAFCLIPVLVNAQERVTIDVNYVGGNFESRFDYPKEKDLLSGKRYQTEGVRIEATVSIVENVAVEYRYERDGLRNAEFFTRSNNNRMLMLESDTESTGGIVGYQEVSVNLQIPKSYGHALIIGVAKTRFDRTWHSELAGGYDYSLHNSHVGFTAGGSGKQRLGAVTFDYAGRFYPRLNRHDGNSTTSSHGYELRGTVTWMQSRHVGVTGGYQIRRLRTEVPPDEFWPINEWQTDKKFVVGTRISF